MAPTSRGGAVRLSLRTSAPGCSVRRSEVRAVAARTSAVRWRLRSSVRTFLSFPAGGHTAAVMLAEMDEHDRTRFPTAKVLVPKPALHP